MPTLHAIKSKQADLAKLLSQTEKHVRKSLKLKGKPSNSLTQAIFAGLAQAFFLGIGEGLSAAQKRSHKR